MSICPSIRPSTRKIHGVHMDLRPVTHPTQIFYWACNQNSLTIVGINEPKTNWLQLQLSSTGFDKVIRSIVRELRALTRDHMSITRLKPKLGGRDSDSLTTTPHTIVVLGPYTIVYEHFCIIVELFPSIEPKYFTVVVRCH